MSTIAWGSCKPHGGHGLHQQGRRGGGGAAGMGPGPMHLLKQPPYTTLPTPKGRLCSGEGWDTLDLTQLRCSSPLAPLHQHQHWAYLCMAQGVAGSKLTHGQSDHGSRSQLPGPSKRPLILHARVQHNGVAMREERADLSHQGLFAASCKQ
jgi:hypothetical protein